LTAQTDARLPAWFQERQADAGIALLQAYGVAGFEAYKGVAYVPQAVIGRIAVALNALVERNAAPVVAPVAATPVNVRRLLKQLSVYRRSLWSPNAAVRGMAAAALIQTDKDITRHYNAHHTPPLAAVAPLDVVTEGVVTDTATDTATDIPAAHVRTVLARLREKEALDRYFRRLQHSKDAARARGLAAFERWRVLHEWLHLPFDRHLTDFIT
jgi:hypothetical protein